MPWSSRVYKKEWMNEWGLKLYREQTGWGVEEYTCGQHYLKRVVYDEPMIEKSGTKLLYAMVSLGRNSMSKQEPATTFKKR